MLSLSKIDRIVQQTGIVSSLVDKVLSRIVTFTPAAFFRDCMRFVAVMAFQRIVLLVKHHGDITGAAFFNIAAFMTEEH